MEKFNHIHLTKQINDIQVNELGVAAQISFWQSLAVAHFHSDTVTAFATQIASPYFNLVVACNSSADLIEKLIVQVKEYFQQQEVNWVWLVGTSTTPKNIARFLKKQGLFLLEYEPALYFDLTPPISIISLANVIIEEVDSQEKLLQWLMPIKEAFPSADDGQEFLQLNAKLGFGPGTPFRHYILRIQEEVVAAATLFVTLPSTMVHHLATRIKFRKQGYARALLAHLLAQAKALNAHHCFLDCPETGISLYQKLGFRIYDVKEVYGLL